MNRENPKRACTGCLIEGEMTYNFSQSHEPAAGWETITADQIKGCSTDPDERGFTRWVEPPSNHDCRRRFLDCF